MDVVLSGTLLRAGRGTACQRAASRSPVRDRSVVPHSAQVTLGDIFQLQDTLARQIVESLALPLSGRERRALGHDVPSNAKAYEFYLRANPLSHDSGSWEVARDLYSSVSPGRPALRARVGASWPRVSRHWQVPGHIRGLRPQRGRAEPCARAQSGSLHCGPLLCAARGGGPRSGTRSDGQARSSRLVTRAATRNYLQHWCRPAGTAVCCSTHSRRTNAPRVLIRTSGQASSTRSSCSVITCAQLLKPNERGRRGARGACRWRAPGIRMPSARV